MLMRMFKMLTSMRLDNFHRSSMTNTLAWNLTLSEPPQHGKPRLTLLGHQKHSSLDPSGSVSAYWTEAFRDAVDQL